MSGRYLADTVAAILAIRADRRLGDRAGGLIADRQSEVLISVASIWEITWKIQIGKLPTIIAPGCTGVAETLARAGFVAAPITAEDAEGAANLPAIHRDPMDRFIIATALREGVPVLTNDHIFAAYGVEVVW